MESISNIKKKLNQTDDKCFNDDYTYHINNNLINYEKKITKRKYFPLYFQEIKNRCRVVISDLHDCYCITNVGLLIPNLYLRDLDKIDFEIEIGGYCIDKINNLRVFMMLNPKMKFENGSLHISLLHNILDNNNPLYWIGLYNTCIAICFNFGDSMIKKLINEYILYVDYKTTESLNTNQNIQLYENYKSPIVKRKIFQNQYDYCIYSNTILNKNIQKHRLNFHHPTHYFYLYWDDYLDHLKNITLYFDNNRLNCVDVTKLNMNNDDFFETINNDILLYQNTIKHNLNLLPKCIIENILVPYLYNSCETFNKNKIIYVIKIDPNFDPNNYNLKTQTINLSKVDSLIVCVETDEKDKNTIFHIGCLSSNIIQQYYLGTTDLYFSG